MANIDHERKRITAVLLFYGPPGAGKTTSLYALARHLPPGTHGKVAPLQPGDDRLLRLDYRPHDHELVYGYQLSFRLVTCPGAVEVDLVRPVLAAADAVMFVADSASNSLNANVKALELLEKMARSAGRRLTDVPMVFMYNKRDLRDALEIRLLESRLNQVGGNYLAASAIRGQGVLEALQRLTATVAVQLRTELQAEPGVQGSTAATVAHGTTFQQARAIHGGQDVDDVTAVSPDAVPAPAAGAGWDLRNDDKTEVNPMGGGWNVDGQPQPPAPARRAAPAPRPAARAATPQRREVPSRGDTARRAAPSQPSRGRAAHGQTSRAAPIQDTGDFTDISAYTNDSPADPVVAADGQWRTPDALADFDSDDHTMPYTDFASEVGDVPDAPSRIDSGPQTGPASALSGRRPSSSRASRRAPTPSRATPAVRPAPTPRPAQRQVPVQRAAPVQRQAPARAPARPPAQRATASMRTSGQDSRARRVEPPARQAPPVAARAAEPRPVGAADPGGSFTKTMAINALGREAEAWEAGLEQAGHPVRVRVPDLAGYVVSRIGTPKAASRRTVRVPIRATHMDTLVPQDFLVDLEFRGSSPGAAPAVSARKTNASDQRTVPLWWLFASVGAVAIVVMVLWLALYANG